MKLPYLLLPCLLLLCACQETRQPQPTDNTSEVLTSSKVSFSRSESNIIEDIYEEQLAKDKELNALHEQIKLSQANVDKSLEVPTKYLYDNNQFYNAASNYLNHISDTVLRKSIEQLIKNSNNRFGEKTTALAAIISKVKNQSKSLSDYQTALKIYTVNQVIEQYQKDALPKLDALQATSLELDKTTKTTQKAIGK